MEIPDFLERSLDSTDFLVMMHLIFISLLELWGDRLQLTEHPQNDFFIIGLSDDLDRQGKPDRSRRGRCDLAVEL